TGSWNTTLLAARTAIGSRATSNPTRLARPPLGAIVVVSIPIVVDLPAPFGPSRPNTSPAVTSKSIPRTASAPPGYVLLRPTPWIAGGSIRAMLPFPTIDTSYRGHTGRGLLVRPLTNTNRRT